MMELQEKIVNNNLIHLIDSLLAHIETTSDLSSELVNYIKSEDTVNRTVKLNTLNESLDIFVKGVIMLHSKYKAFEQYTPMEMNTLKTAEIHMLSILKGIKMALEKSDDIILMDLIEYELRDNLTQWKIRVLPKLKNLIL